MFRALFILPLLLTLQAAEPLIDFGGGLSAPPEPSAELSSEAAAIAPGEPFTAAVHLPHPAGWHSYYKNSGGVEQPPSLAWELPDGFTHGPIQWPVPETFEGDLGTGIGYLESVTLLVEITPPADLETGTSVTLAVDAAWQYCQPGKCINRQADLSLELPVAAEADIDTEKFAELRAQLPITSDSRTFAATREGNSMTLRVETDATDAPVRFIPDQPFVAPTDFATPERTDDTLLIHLRQATDVVDDPIPLGDEISGILIFESGPAISVPPTQFGKAPQPAVSAVALLPILGGMLLGGLILNLMPCVFPVIGLKIMGFVQQAGQDRKKIALHGVAFTVGVLISFWILSGILFALRAAAAPGEDIGWGYQLQNPWTVFILMLVMFVLGLTMYGVFEVGATATGVGGKLQSKQGLPGSFFSGVLATIVATPCSAPLLGVAIGASMALPAFQFFTAFTFMALGLALPYLVLSIFPKLLDYLPRPGPWMESFKQAMSFLLFATAGFLLWVYAGQIELDNLLNVIIGLTLIAIAAWVFGRWDTPARSAGVRTLAKVCTVAFAIGGILAAMPPEKSALEWQVWSQDRVEELNAAGTPVFVDFTAQWCATCQVNKRVAYTDEVIQLMNDRGIVALKADKTSPDPKIDAALERLGRSAIPVNVLHIPGREPIITPEVLTPAYLLELFSTEVQPRGDAT